MIDPRLLQAVGDFLLSRQRSDRPALIGLAGSQGSGKSTLAAALATRFGGVALSLDDVYLTKAEREKLADSLHPLFVTRGPPLTHDLLLLERTIEALATAQQGSLTPLPAFDKLADERVPLVDWPVFAGRPAVIILEGWCLGAEPEPEARLVAPVNRMEAELDADGLWRGAINQALADDYARLRQRLDGLVFLKAPDFDRVLDWRCQQEAGLMGLEAVDNSRRVELASFIARFERLTRWMMQGGICADIEIALDGNRHAVAIKNRQDIPCPD